jgi:hypothetical protein
MRKRSLRAWVAGAVLVLAGCDRAEAVTSGDIGLSSTGGWVVVHCIDNDFAKLTGWEAAPGYVARVVVQGPSKEASLVFENGSAMDIRVAVRCVDNQPRMKEFND